MHLPEDFAAALVGFFRLVDAHLNRGRRVVRANAVIFGFEEGADVPLRAYFASVGDVDALREEAFRSLLCDVFGDDRHFAAIERECLEIKRRAAEAREAPRHDG